MTGIRAGASRKVTTPAIVRGFASGVFGYLVSLGFAWLLLAALGSRDSADAVAAKLLNGSVRGVALAVAAAAGVPVGWHVPSLGMSSRLVPWRLLVTGLPLAPFVLAPLARVASGVCLTPRHAIRRCRARAR